MIALMFWVDNSKSQMMEASLNNQRQPNKEKVQLLKALAEEENEKKSKNNPFYFANKPPNR